jgi:hypothetical protein
LAYATSSTPACRLLHLAYTQPSPSFDRRCLRGSKSHMGLVCFLKIMFTDSHNVGDRLVEPDAAFEIREARIQSFYLANNTYFHVLSQRRTNVPLFITCHLSTGLIVANRQDRGTQELNSLETAKSSTNIPYHHTTMP